jgi:hypothetical protein
MQKSISMLVATIFFGTLNMQMAAAQDAASKLTEEEAHAIGVDAYVYLYPLVTMDITRLQFTNTDKGIGRGPMNAFSNVPAYPPASDKTVVRSNYDTLYSLSYLDLLKEPVVVSVPTLRAVIISCRCSTCGLTCSHRPAGALRERRRPTSW